MKFIQAHSPEGNPLDLERRERLLWRTNRSIEVCEILGATLFSLAFYRFGFSYNLLIALLISTLFCPFSISCLKSRILYIANCISYYITFASSMYELFMNKCDYYVDFSRKIWKMP